MEVYPLVIEHSNGKIQPFLMGKSTISTGPCSIAMLVYQRVCQNSYKRWPVYGIYRVDLPTKDGDFPQRSVSLPEGK